jgi:hypothetical protein
LCEERRLTVHGLFHVACGLLALCVAHRGPNVLRRDAISIASSILDCKSSQRWHNSRYANEQTLSKLVWQQPHLFVILHTKLFKALTGHPGGGIPERIGAMVTFALIAFAALLAFALVVATRKPAQAPARVRVENINLPLRRRSRR